MNEAQPAGSWWQSFHWSYDLQTTSHTCVIDEEEMERKGGNRNKGEQRKWQQIIVSCYRLPLALARAGLLKSRGGGVE